MPKTISDRNMLYGVLAWKAGFISSDQFLAGMSAWNTDKVKSLGEVLIDQGAMTPERRDVLEGIVDAHIQTHEGGPPSISFGGPAETISLAAAMPQDASGTFVGSPSSSGLRFQILRDHAQGGLGKVSLARDAELNREVALKEIRPEHAYDAASRERFVREAEITGGLEHPGLAPVYALGTFADGRPFYAMRFIRGESLSAAIQRFHELWSPMRKPALARPISESDRLLEMRRLLGRLMHVCQTMHYAHSRGVIHRDLKPANIMLGRYGETLVVDWGLAKAIGNEPQDLAPHEQAHASDSVPAAAPEPPICPRTSANDAETQRGAALGTPAYMSPEQANGWHDQLGPASDIYSLGATLYCILAGRAPFGGGSKHDVLQRAQRGEFVAPCRINPAIPRPLSAICLKAMASQPQMRYGSAIALAEDIERFLADEPVAAWHEPLSVRSRRWLRKHRGLASSAAASVLVALLAVSIGLFIVGGFNRKLAAALVDLSAANDAESKAHDNTRLAQERTRIALNTVTDDVIADLLGKQNQNQLTERERAFLRKVLKFYEQFAASQGATGQARRDQVDGYLRVGKIRQRLGEFKDAEAAYRSALAHCQQLAADDVAAAAYREDVSRIQSNLGTLLSATGRFKDAEAAHRESLAIHKQLAREFPNVTAYRNAVGIGYMNIGNLLRDTSRRQKAETAYGDARGILQQLAAEFPNIPGYRRDLAMIQNNRGILLHDLGRLPEAEAAYRDSVALMGKLVTDSPTSAALRHSHILGQHNFGNLLAETGRPREAEAAYRTALAAALQLAADFPTVPAYRQGLAVAHNGLGLHLERSGQPDNAEAAYREAVAILRRLAADFPAAPSYRESLASTYNQLGILLRERGRPRESETAYRDALALRKKLAAEVPTNPAHRQELARIHHNIGALQYFLHRHNEAQTAYHEALSLRQKLAADFPKVAAYRRDVAKSQHTLGLLLIAMKKPREAEAAYREALAARRKLTADFPAVPTYRHELAASHNDLGTFLANQGRPQEAEASVREALGLWQKLTSDFPTAGDYANNTAVMLITLARHKNVAKEHVEAKKLLDQARPHHRAALQAYPKHRLYRQALRDNYLFMCKALSGLGDHAALATEAEELARFGFDLAGDANQATGFVASCVLLSQRDEKLTESKRRQLASNYADRALVLLRRAIANGFRDSTNLLKNSDLDPLRNRPDFQKLLKELESRVKSSPPKQR